MRMITKTRTFMEVNVGSHHSAEVILFLRRADFDWFNSNAAQHYQEVLDLMTRSIIPRMCYKEIERFYEQKYPHRFPPDAIGKKNNIKINGKGTKRKRGAGAGKKQTAAAAAAAEAVEEDKEEVKKAKDVYYAFGETLHISYRTEELDVYSSATLLYTPPPTTTTTTTSRKNTKKKNNSKTSSSSTDDAGSGGFRQLNKLSKRFLLWCYKTTSSADDDPTTGTDCSAAGGGGGFLRPEMIPIAHLFRNHQTEDNEGDDAPKRKK